MFSDESTFRTLRAVQRKVRRPIGSYRYSSHYTVKTMKHPDSVMVWACFTGDVGRGGLYFLPKNVTMNGERYKEVLENHLLPFMEIHRASHFLQDGAPCHTSKKVKDFLKEKDVVVMDWPGNSPDLNPIENVWNNMKNKLRKKAITSVPVLQQEIMKLWVLETTQEYLKKLSDSMPKRLQLVIKHKGEMTKY
jgi:transposase